MSLVLVAEDDGDLRALYTELLEQLGHQVVSAADGVLALELAIQHEPALVLTDWHMPRMDGIELCKALRARFQLRPTRLILHSSDVVPEPWHADLCLRKTGDPWDIQCAVQALLDAAPLAPASGGFIRSLLLKRGRAAPHTRMGITTAVKLRSPGAWSTPGLCSSPSSKDTSSVSVTVSTSVR